MLKKRVLFIFSLVLITVACYIFMNRNYDPLARYAYDIDQEEKQEIIKYLDQREIKYIVDYAIAPKEFTPYMHSYYFNVFNIDKYGKARNYLYFLNNNEIVNVVELIERKGLNLDDCLNNFMYKGYEEIIDILMR